jgi:steroid 5-alpha reductase family enzyme
MIALENPIGLIAVFSLFIMLHFLMNISGKALLEKGMRRRYSDYADYEARVSGFFPRPPKNTGA